MRCDSLLSWIAAALVNSLHSISTLLTDSWLAMPVPYYWRHFNPLHIFNKNTFITVYNIVLVLSDPLHSMTHLQNFVSAAQNFASIFFTFWTPVLLHKILYDPPRYFSAIMCCSRNRGARLVHFIFLCSTTLQIAGEVCLAPLLRSARPPQLMISLDFVRLIKKLPAFMGPELSSQNPATGPHL
jgi:hypothetical protein